MHDPAAPLRVGIVGTGGIARAHLPGWQDLGAELHCVGLQGADKGADWDGKSSVNGGRDQKAEMFPIDTSVADAPGVRVTVESETDFEQFPGKEKH